MMIKKELNALHLNSQESKEQKKVELKSAI